MIQLCPTCGQMRIHHPGGELYKCPTPPEVIEALRRYRAENGKAWKAKLCEAWMLGKELGWELQWARNAFGPRRLYKLSI